MGRDSKRNKETHQNGVNKKDIFQETEQQRFHPLPSDFPPKLLAIRQHHNNGEGGEQETQRVANVNTPMGKCPINVGVEFNDVCMFVERVEY